MCVYITQRESVVVGTHKTANHRMSFRGLDSTHSVEPTKKEHTDASALFTSEEQVCVGRAQYERADVVHRMGCSRSCKRTALHILS
jgi:hypothetical protein